VPGQRPDHPGLHKAARAAGCLRGVDDAVEQGAGLVEAALVPVGPVLPDEQARQGELVELG
jgi:hypothetical protein